MITNRPVAAGKGQDPGCGGGGLFKFIMNPAMLTSFFFGIVLLLGLGEAAWSEAWLHVKLLLVAGLLVAHMAMGRWRREFAEDRNTRPRKFYRIANEVPTALMIAIVILVVVRPF